MCPTIQHREYNGKEYEKERIQVKIISSGSTSFENGKVQK